MYTTAIFDLDGTLLYTLEDIADSVNATMEHFHLPAQTLDQVRAHVGNGGRRLIERSVPGGAANPRFEEIHSYYEPYYQSHCQIKTRPYDGIMDMLRSLEKHQIRMAIVSNKADGAVKELAQQYFEGIVKEAVGEREDQGIRKKPDPSSVLEAMRLLRSTKEETIYIGDSEVDYETSRNAGVPVVLCSWGFRERKKLESLKPEFLIDRPSQLLKIFHCE